jgi:hypothetical protein
MANGYVYRLDGDVTTVSYAANILFLPEEDLRFVNDVVPASVLEIMRSYYDEYPDVQAMNADLQTRRGISGDF